MHQTPWTKKASSLPSDRIKPSHAQLAASRNSAKGNGKNSNLQPPKSKEVRKLEFLLNALRRSTGNEKDPKMGCFCQAREHSLSSYSPICLSCGLILCSINEPQYCCPYCAKPLLTAVPRNSLMAQLEAQISDTIAKEAEERERGAEEARKASGAFPALVGTSPISKGQPTVVSPGVLRPVNESHKVLSLNSKTKKVTVSSYSTNPSSSRPISRAESVKEEVIRVPPPPPEVAFATKPMDPMRPYADLMGNGAKYVARSRIDNEETSKGAGRKRRKNKGNAKEAGSSNDITSETY